MRAPEHAGQAGWRVAKPGAGGGGLGSALTYQNLQKSRVPINSILGFIIRTYKKVGFGRLGSKD